MSLDRNAGQRLLDWLAAHQDELVATLGLLVRSESPSGAKPELDALADRLTDRFGPFGAIARIVHPTGDHLRLHVPGGPGRPALVLCHYDTVWPLGSLAANPFRVEDGVVRGPGCFDMKGGIVLLEYALRALAALGLELPRPLTVLLSADEEVGSPTSRPLIEAEAPLCEYVLVLESPLPGGVLKTARKGVGRFTLEIEGRAAHAGVEPERGVSAIVELAHQTLRVHALNAPEVGTTVNVGVVAGGTRPNVVAARARAEIDVRVATLAEAERVAAALQGLTPVLPEARLTVSGGLNRPPMERTPASAALFVRAREIARAALDQDLQEGATGGGSDGNFTAALGLPTLDGLGPDGRGAHAADEHVLVASLAPRAALLAALLHAL